MRYFDSHCHLQLPQFDADREAVLMRMQEQKVGGVVVGTDLETSRAALELAKTRDFLWASVGLHPNEEYIGLPYVELEELAKDPKVVAIGECGLDYFRSGGTDEEKSAQKKRFEMQIALAQKVNKVLIIHCRDSQQRIANTKSAHGDILAILQEQKLTIPVVIHFFTGSAELAQHYLALSCYLSFPGPITYTDQYDESIRATPLKKILSETDSPFAAPVPHRGMRNEPNFVVEVVHKISALKGISTEAAGEQITRNSQLVFKLQ